MIPIRRVLAVVVVLGCVLGVVAPARAEWFAAIYLGLGITSNNEVTFTTRQPRTWEDVEFLNSVVWGARAGYWFADNAAIRDALGEFSRYLGADLDVSYFRPRIPSQTANTEVGPRRLGGMDISVVTLTPELLARYPLLVDREYPMGRVQPYVAFGPTIFFSSADDSGSFGPRGGSASDQGLGVVVRPGVQWYVTENVALFGEYRFVHFAPTYDFTRGPVDLAISSHHFNIGVSYTFGR
jgi:opacity protein-like surface antigen